MAGEDAEDVGTAGDSTAKSSATERIQVCGIYLAEGRFPKYGFELRRPIVAPYPFVQSRQGPLRTCVRGVANFLNTGIYTGFMGGTVLSSLFRTLLPMGCGTTTFPAIIGRPIHIIIIGCCLNKDGPALRHERRPVMITCLASIR